ncbi:MAG: alpha/beta fold hydrolase [Candidatus Lokiarchaeota archaeon]|nr:alpha/beta fold hydrolase [Candidatus Lokiarchaeota archaeon]
MYFSYVRTFLAAAIAEGIACAVGFFFWDAAGVWALLCSLGLFALLSLMLVVAYVRLISGDWGNLTDDTFLTKESVDIAMADGWQMACKVLKAPGQDDKLLPVVICHHGLTGNGRKYRWLSVPLAMRGFLVVVPDARAHGESAKRLKRARKDDWYVTEATGIMPDFKRVLDYACSRPDADTSRIAAIGGSLGGATLLVSALPDPRVKLVIPMSAFYSFVDLIEAKRGKVPLSEPWFSKHVLHNVIDFGKLRRLNERISPRYVFDKIPREEAIRKVRLVHSKDDNLVLPEASAEKIISHLGLPASSVFLTEKGDHSLRGQETAVLARVLRWLEEAFPPS